MKLIVTMTAAILLAACATGPDANAINVTLDGNQFTGEAGSDWTEEEIQSNSFGVVCTEGETVADLAFSRDASGVATFSGRCVPAS